MARPRIVHKIDRCQDCDWRDDDYRTGHAKARYHAKTTGHRILVETGYNWVIGK